MGGRFDALDSFDVTITGTNATFVSGNKLPDVVFLLSEDTAVEVNPPGIFLLGLNRRAWYGIFSSTLKPWSLMAARTSHTLSHVLSNPLSLRMMLSQNEPDGVMANPKPVWWS